MIGDELDSPHGGSREPRRRSGGARGALAAAARLPAVRLTVGQHSDALCIGTVS